MPGGSCSLIFGGSCYDDGAQPEPHWNLPAEIESGRNGAYVLFYERSDIAEACAAALGGARASAEGEDVEMLDA